MNSRAKGGDEIRRPAPKLLSVLLVVALVSSLVVSVVLLGGRQFVLVQYYDQLETMETEVVALREEIRRDKAELNRSDSDPFWTEKAARERMNYAVPGELIFRFQDS